MTAAMLPWRIAKALFLGILIAAIPVRVEFTAGHGLAFGFQVAHAKDGERDGNSGRGGGDDGGDSSGRGRGGDDGDSSGRGGGGDDGDDSGRGGGGDDGGDGDGRGGDDSDDRDDGGRRGGGDDGEGSARDDGRDDDGDDDGRGGRSSGEGRRSGAAGDISLKYSNGWVERIESGRYSLIDPQGRTVADRRARPGDARRMRDVLGQ